MLDLRKRFKELDRLDAPDMRSDIEQRAAVPSTLLETASEGAPWWRGSLVAVGAAVVVLVVIAATVLVWRGPDTPAITTIPESPTTTTAIPLPGVDVGAADRVFDVALAPDGRLWAATAAGVVAWDLDAASFTMFSEAEGLGGRSVNDVAVAADGTVWAAGNGWVARYDEDWSVVGDDVLADLPTSVVDLAAGPDGAVWMAAGSDSLFRIDGTGATKYSVPGAWGRTEPWARSMAVDSAGTVWVSTIHSGVLAFDGEWRHFGVGDGLPSDIVGNVAVASDGSVWVGGDGLYGEPGGDVPAGGILRYRDGTWTVYTTADGLLANGGSVTIDPAGGVWVVHDALAPGISEALGTELLDGISRFDGTGWLVYPKEGGRGAGAVSTDGTLWLPSLEGIVGFDGTETIRRIVGPEGVPPLASAGDAMSLERAEGLEPVRLSTSIGEIEFTTWAVRGDGEPPWWLAETDHGVIAFLHPDRVMSGSPDGVTWTEIPLSVEPHGWMTFGDELFVFGRGGAVRAEWDGARWTETGPLTATDLNQGAAGPRGMVAADGEQVYYWEVGTGFTEATQPPNRTLHPEPSAGCSAPGWTGEGIMAKLGPMAGTSDGFIVLAARSEADWHRTPACEPLVWLSSDGDTWRPTSDESPFGQHSFVVDMAVTGGRIVAAGGVSRTEAAVWISDDGITWERADLDAAQMWQVAGSGRGWIAVGNHDSNQTADLAGDMWFSTDGLTWDGPYERPPGWADATGILGVAMLDDRIIGVGEQLNVMPEGSPPAGVVVGEFIDE